MKNTRLVAAITIAVALAGCSGEPVKPLEDGNEVKNISAEESRVWSEADKFDEAFAKSDQIYRDPDSTVYLQQIMDRLYPEFKGIIKVRIAKSPYLNAFALPNGSIYFNLGLLARAENEAQLATVLAHEGAHFVHKHGFRQRKTIKNSTAFAMVTGVAGVPIVGDVMALSSIYGFSRDLEREADKFGYEHLVKAGYDPGETYKIFEKLAAEVKILDVKQPYFFSTHPKLEERIKSFQSLNEKNGKGGEIRRAEFLAATKKIRIACLKSDLSLDRYKSIILVLENSKTLESYPPSAYFYLGEAYRRRGDEGDIKRSVDNYLLAKKLAPEFVPTYRSLGIYYMKQKQFKLASVHLGRYLELAPNAPDRRYVEKYYRRVNRELRK